jgi:hypothetical protein
MIFVEAEVFTSNIGLFSYDPEAGVPAAVDPDLRGYDEMVFGEAITNDLPFAHACLAIHPGAFLRDRIQLDPLRGLNI